MAKLSDVPLESEVRMYFAEVMTFEDKLSRDEIMRCIKNEQWQAFRKGLKGLSTQAKLARLRTWKSNHSGRCASVVVQNYINALKRGGQIK